jgi:outer membrane lipoprotein-sorting protein
MLLTAALAAVALTQGSRNILDYTLDGLRDVSFTQRVVSGNQRELRKINVDFANSYRFTSARVWLREPFMLRMESTVDDTQIFFLVNGTRKLVRVPRSRINFREDLSMAPGKRQTAFDFGLMPPSLFRDFFQASFVRMDRATGHAVFDVNFVPRLNNRTRHRIWIDPQRDALIRREWYAQDGRLMATFIFDEFVQKEGMWLPTRGTVRNADNAVAGVTRFENVQVNQGIPASLFDID